MKKLIITLIVLGVIAGSVGAYYRYRGSGEEVKVSTLAIGRGDITESVGATGTLQAVTTVVVGSQVSGNIKALYADYNSIVKQGQVIAQIDPAIFQAQVDQAKANVLTNQANLLNAQSNLVNAKANLVKAEVAVVDAKRTVDRNLPLVEKKV